MAEVAGVDEEGVACAVDAVAGDKPEAARDGDVEEELAGEGYDAVD